MDAKRYIIPLFEGYCRQMDIDNKDIKCKVGEHPFNLKVASTPQSQAKGYMKSETGPEDGQGILFVYPDEQILRFWMRDVPFPLDILFFDSNNNLVGYETMEPGSSEESRIYRSPKPARYALETRAGWAQENLKGESQYKLEI